MANKTDPEIMAGILTGLEEALLQEGYADWKPIVFLVHENTDKESGHVVVSSAIPPDKMELVLKKQLERMNTVQAVFIVEETNMSKH